MDSWESPEEEHDDRDGHHEQDDLLFRSLLRSSNSSPRPSIATSTLPIVSSSSSIVASINDRHHHPEADSSVLDPGPGRAGVLIRISIDQEMVRHLSERDIHQGGADEERSRLSSSAARIACWSHQIDADPWVQPPRTGIWAGLAGITKGRGGKP